MNRIRKYSKRIAAILIISLCINTHSAIVSDNDGSAFITKAEFESLKTSFQEQVDNYEASVDGKIDGAIASYLAGITLSNKQQWYSEYGVDKFVFYARDVATSLPKIKFDAYYAYKSTNVTNSEEGAWGGGLEWKSTSPKTSTTSLCIGNPIGTNEFKLKRYDKDIELKGAFTFVKDGTSTSIKNTYIARNGGTSWLWINANYDSSKNKTYMRGLNVQMKDAVYDDNYTPPLRICAYTNTSYIDITTKNGLRC